MRFWCYYHSTEHELSAGKAAPAGFASSPPPGAISEKKKELVLKRIREVPSLPEVVNQIIEKLGQRNTPASELATLISYDPGLTSRVLRMVNSSAYGVQRQVTSIQHAIMLLGFNTVRGLVLSASILKLLGGKEHKASGNGLFDHTAYWRHCILTAMLARQLATAYRLPEADEAFSAGMLHDIGKLVLHQYFAAESAHVLKIAHQQGQEPHGLNYYALEQRLIGTTHCEIGGLLGAKWKLPASLTEVIQQHHNLEKAVLNPALVHVVAMANSIATTLQRHTELNELFTHLPKPLHRYFELQTPDDLVFIVPVLQPCLDELEELLQQFRS